MIHSKYVRNLSMLDASTLSRYRDFLKGPYPRRRKVQARFLDALNTYALSSQPQSPETGKVELYQHVYQSDPRKLSIDKPAMERKVNKLLAEGLSLLHEFLGWETASQNPSLVAYLKIRANLSSIDIDERTQLLRDANEKLKTSSLPSSLETLGWQYEAALVMFENQLENREYPTSGGTVSLLDKLENYYLSHKLRLFCAIRAQQQVFSDKEGSLNPVNLAWELSGIEARWKSLPTIGKAFYLANLMMEGSDTDADSAFHQFIEEIRSLAEYPTSELQDLYSLAVNYIAQNLNTRGHGFLQDAETVMAVIFQKEENLARFQFPERLLTNAIYVSLRLGNIARAEEMLKAYANLLPKEGGLRGIFTEFNKGVISFFSREWGEVKERMLKVKNANADPFYNMEARLYLLKCQFERLLESYLLDPDSDLQEEIDDLEMILVPFPNYLREPKKVSSAHVQNYKAFLDGFRKLNSILRSRLAFKPVSEKQLRSMKLFIESKPHAASHHWLNAKADQFLKGFLERK